MAVISSQLIEMNHVLHTTTFMAHNPTYSSWPLFLRVVIDILKFKKRLEGFKIHHGAPLL